MSARLEKEVWALDRCCGCGNCVALCSKGMLFWGTGDAPHLEMREKALGLSHTTLDSCSFCEKFCELGCPQLEETRTSLAPWRVVSARTRGLVQSGEPTDVIKHLLVASLAGGLIDGALVPDMDPWSLEPVTRVATTVGEVMDTLGLSQLWAPALTALNEAVYEKRLHDLAVVGTPCTAQAVHKVRAGNHTRLNPYRQALRLSIATFCAGVYRPEMVHGLLADELGVDARQIKRLEVVPGSETLSVHLWDGTTGAVDLDEVEGYMRSGCARCDDYLGESADLAIGTLGAQPGYATLIVRSQTGEIALRNAIHFGLIEISDHVDRAALSRASEAKERRQRAQAFDNLMIMMLDALGEPRKRAEVKQAFVRMYEVKRPERAEREEAGCHVSCGEC